ncbi:MAG: uroporphyrinogen decarboxylase family protein [Spirochaetia bacterium]|jgi:uroporphyrinogen decarboxylase
MSGFKVPVQHPKPDIERFMKAMEGKIILSRPPMVEYLVDNALMKPILVEHLGRQWIDTSDKTEYMGGQMDLAREDTKTLEAWLENQIAFWYHMGYDFIRVEVSLPLPADTTVIFDTAKGNERYNRAWQKEGTGPIQSWDDFERYPWPSVGEANFYIHRYINSHLPDGLGFFTCHAGGVYEHVSRLMGFEGLCLGLYDQPDLVQAVVDKIGALIFEYNKYLLELGNLSAVFQGEDFGFNTQTLLPPDIIRKYFLPWHSRYANQAHARRIPYYLHSCGCVDSIMDDLIDQVGIDGKHSFQDSVLPAAEAKKRWGNRICILGGVDVHKLTILQESDLRLYVRSVIDQCAPGGRFAIGAGNSIPSYIPLRNYFTLLDEALS